MASLARHGLLLTSALALAGASFFGCGDSAAPTGTEGTPSSSSAGSSSGASSSTGDASSSTGGDPFEGCDAVVKPSDDDQTAVETAFVQAKADSTICFDEGTYHFTNELDLAQKGVTVRGKGQDKTILDFSGQAAGGNGVLITGDGVTISDLQVLDTPGDGVRATDTMDITFLNVTVAWSTPASVNNGAYGLYPIGCSGVTIDGCEVTGARDAGIYVGQSENIVVQNCESHGNVAGIEIENSTDAEVMNNHAHDNVGGILVFNLPNLPKQGGARANVHDNVIETNNIMSFAEAGTIVSKVPRGIGVIVLASDDNEIHDNKITGNDSTGVVVVSYLALLFGTFTDPNFDPFPTGNWVHDNVFKMNGMNPDGVIKAVAGDPPEPDLMWDGCTDPNLPDPTDPDLVNCVSGNGAATYLNADLCNNPSMPSHDISLVTCGH